MRLWTLSEIDTRGLLSTLVEGDDVGLPDIESWVFKDDGYPAFYIII
jgi:hypothetical protein